jgi:phage repressor protein C with HTH and peptisase S24 domain
MTLADRLKARRDELGLSQDALGKLVGLTQQTIQAIEDGKTLQPRKIDALADALRTTPQWLQFGIEGTAQPRTPYTVDTKYAQVRRYDIAAGAGGTRENGHEEVSGTHAYRRDWLDKRGLVAAACVVIEVDGESMAPTVADGDVVLVNTADRKLANGHVFAFRHEDGPRIKRLFKQLDGRIRLVSDNQDKISFPDEYLTPGMDAEIIGRVVHRSGGV